MKIVHGFSLQPISMCNQASSLEQAEKDLPTIPCLIRFFYSTTRSFLQWASFFANNDQKPSTAAIHQRQGSCFHYLQLKALAALRYYLSFLLRFDILVNNSMAFSHVVFSTKKHFECTRYASMMVDFPRPANQPQSALFLY